MTATRQRWLYQMPGDSRTHWQHDTQTHISTRLSRLSLGRRLCYSCRLIVAEWVVCGSRKMGGPPCSAPVMRGRHLCSDHLSLTTRRIA